MDVLPWMWRAWFVALLATAPLVADDPTLELRDADGRIEARLLPRTDGFRIVDPDGRLLGETRALPDRVRLLNDRGQDVLQVVKKEFGIEILDSEGARRYQIRPDGAEMRLQDPSGADLARLRADPELSELRKPQGETIVKARAGQGRLRFEDGSGKLFLELTGTQQSDVWIWLALSGPSIADRAAICTYFLKVPR